MYGNNNSNNYAQNFPFYNSNGNPANTLSHIQQGEEDVIAQSLGLAPQQQPQQPILQQPQTNNAPPPNLQQRAQHDPNFPNAQKPQILQEMQQLPQMPFNPQQFPQSTPPTASQMSINGRSLSITFSPDGTVTITIS